MTLCSIIEPSKKYYTLTVTPFIAKKGTTIKIPPTRHIYIIRSSQTPPTPFQNTHTHTHFLLKFQFEQLHLQLDQGLYVLLRTNCGFSCRSIARNDGVNGANWQATQFVCRYMYFNKFLQVTQSSILVSVWL